MKNSPWQVRPSVLIPALAVIIPSTIVLIVAGCLAYHPVRVWLADGYWCVRFSPSGTRTILYGSECDR
ncbi:MAG: hypothetical protein J0L70_23675 [Leptolyngbya sp. UWPOB_LEPTO1]|uniref:hypothetical protein n=1 Tax=Leptolyngbya sp. UWPOB_LEPTO1 TaxID=2815653 RepID=UPI001ACEFB16|nr:hypothetical protein [Leptolyngbya sp. UWPOB_LEPTO1]MBN8563543.1 hypothetical protein [Leptolyngbya sp. UWPOB_LEPTO1]